MGAAQETEGQTPQWAPCAAPPHTRGSTAASRCSPLLLQPLAAGVPSLRPQPSAATLAPSIPPASSHLPRGRPLPSLVGSPLLWLGSARGSRPRTTLDTSATLLAAPHYHPGVQPGGRGEVSLKAFHTGSPKAHCQAEACVEVPQLPKMRISAKHISPAVLGKREAGTQILPNLMPKHAKSTDGVQNMSS